MANPRSLIIPALLLAAALAPRAAAAEGTPLMVLERTENGKVVPTEIEATPGVYFMPPPARPAAQWRIAPGADVEAEQPPPERVVDFLRKTGEAIEPLCRVEVRFFRHGEKWRPAYRLDETPLFARDAAGRWRPISVAGGNPALIQRLGATLPNAEGYFPDFEFALSTGPFAIDSWRVR